ncbi:MAG: transcriptional repressor [Actinomycetia bacterium]|nr:transcriptional repressor [Actinomycetes bacterium]
MSASTVILVLAPAELTRAFRARGLKVTPQRQLLFSLLHCNETHPTAEALFAVASKLMPGISLRTVYQTLNDLAAMGELQVVQSAGGSTRFDPNVADHHHAQCDRCGELHDVYVDDLDRLEVSNLAGFRTDRARIVFGGLCAACQSPKPTKKTTKQRS